MSGGLLVITAHPDDEVLIAGGVLAACGEAGIPTGVVCLTRGENGPIADPALATRETLAAVRLQELRDACDRLGVGFVKCFRRQDGNLRWSDRSAIAAQLARVVGERRPEVVVTFGKDGLYYHSDHVAAYELTRLGVRRSGHPAALYRSVWLKSEMRELSTELTRRGLPAQLWGLGLEDFGVEAEERGAEVAVDVRRFTDRKLEALSCHRTQLEAGHALLGLPADLAQRFLGCERFVLVDPPRAASRQTTLFARLARDAAHV